MLIFVEKNMLFSFAFLCILLSFDVGLCSFCLFVFWLDIKSEVSQSQPKLYPWPSETAWTHIHATSATGSSRRGK